MFMGFYLFGLLTYTDFEIEARGKELMEEAYKAEPQCTLYKLHHCIYWGEGKYEPNEQEIAEMREMLPIPSVICEYFRRILLSDSDEEYNLPRFEHYYCNYRR